MKRMKAFFTMLVLVLFSSGVAHADILFNNFGPGNTYFTLASWTIGLGISDAKFEKAIGFTPSATANLESIDFVISLDRGTNEVGLSLVADSSGAPLGPTLESWTFTNQMGEINTVAPVLTADSVLNPLLQAGTLYWLVAFAPASDTSATWYFNSIGDAGPGYESTDGGVTWLGQPPDLQRGVFRINAVPEPSTFLLFGVGLVGVGLLRKRFKK